MRATETFNTLVKWAFRLGHVLCAACLLQSVLGANPKPLSEKQRVAIQAIHSNWDAENERQHLALGEHVYDKDFDRVFTSVLTALSDIGFSVKSTERQSGFITAEGPSPIPDDEARPLAQAMCDEINKAIKQKRFVPSLNNSTKGVTVTVLRLNDHQTKVKLRINLLAVQVRSGVTSSGGHVYPPLFVAQYKHVWKAIDKQIFLDENLDKTQDQKTKEVSGTAKDGK